MVDDNNREMEDDLKCGSRGERQDEESERGCRQNESSNWFHRQRSVTRLIRSRNM